jgi:teichuronic acid biosynthesis glycosyltransferase TuaG
MNSPFFSVIIPTHNRAKFLIEAIESVKNQSFKNYELIIIDDASIDQTQIILVKQHGINFIRNNKNHGVSYSRNQGIRLAKGKYLAFLDSDDLWEKDKLKKQYEYLEKNSFPELLHSNERWQRNGNEFKTTPKT